MLHIIVHCTFYTLAVNLLFCINQANITIISSVQTHRHNMIPTIDLTIINLDTAR